MLSIVSQLGDLFGVSGEAAVRRQGFQSYRFPAMAGYWTGWTDLSQPSCVAAIFGFAAGGVDGVGRGLMVW